jgi:RNA polymerase sigma-70 factor (sigma-E family)
VDQARREAFDALVLLRSPALLRTAPLLCGDRHLAQDLVQTSLSRAYTRWGRLRSIDAGEAYVRKIMLTQASSSRRRRWRGEVPTAAVPDQAEHGDDLDLRATLRQALASVPAPQRAVLVLRFYEDLSEVDTAALLGTSVGTVKSRTSRALASLRAAGVETALAGESS